MSMAKVIHLLEGISVLTIGCLLFNLLLGSDDNT